MPVLEFPVAHCVLCGVGVDMADFCFGCHAFICEGCSAKDIYGHHTAPDHRLTDKENEVC